MVAILHVDRSLDSATVAAELGALIRAGATSVVCDVRALVPDAEAVDGLARLRLAARRLGCDLRVRRASAELHELLDFAGLADVVLDGVEMQREPEERKQLVGVEEERELDDPGT